MESKPAHGKKKGAIRTVKAPCVNWMASRLLVTLMLVVSPLTAVAEAKIEAELKSGHQSTPGAIQKPTPETTTRFQQRYTINLPHQTVAESLNDLARQTGAQFLFPFQLAQSKAANPVKGHFTLLQATQQLLQDTGLKSDLVDGVLTISLIDCEQAETGCDLNNLHGNESEKGKRMNTNKRKNLLATFVTMFAAGATLQANAQNEYGESARAQNVLDEIIVTSEKREQNVQDVPVAISAFSAAMLEARGIDSPESLQFVVPSLSLAEESAGGGIRVTLRGIGTEGGAIGEPGVPLHINGHYTRSTAYLFRDFLDVERVEVQRGPQGTLYGRNAVGGNINLITRRPTDELEGSIGFNVGNYQKRQIQAVLNTPINDRLRTRLAISDSERDGYIENLNPGGEDRNDSDYSSIRGSIEYDLSDDVQIYAAAYRFDDSGDTIPLTTLDPAFSESDPFKTLSNAPHGSTDESDGVSMNISWDLGGMEFRSLSAYDETVKSDIGDEDGGNTLRSETTVATTTDTFTQEFQLISTDDSHLQWVVGAFYYKENQDFFIDGLRGLASPRFRIVVPGELENTSWAAFGQLDYALTDRLTLVGGLRYTKDKKTRTAGVGFGVEDGPFPPLTVAVNVGSEDEWSKVTGKLGINYHLNDDAMAYASWSRGYKAGGFNVTQTEPFGPETVDAYEVGLKSQWLESRLQANVAAFYYDYQDKQDVQQISAPGALLIRATRNASTANVKGVEFEVQALVTDGLSVDMSVGYLDAEFDEYITFDPLFSMLGDQNLSRNALPYSPEWTAHLGAQYEWNLDDNLGRLTARVGYSWVDDRWTNAFNRLGGGPIQGTEGDFLPDYEVINARLQWESASANWLVALYANNLTDEVIKLRSGTQSNGSVRSSYYAPRTYGLNLTYTF